MPLRLKLEISARILDSMEANPNRRTDSLAIVGICVAIVLFSILSEGSEYSVSLFGIRLPSLCPFKWITGLDCPACGLTRSLVLLFHGQFQASIRMNLFGIPLATFFLFQIPFQLYLAFTGQKNLGFWRFFKPQLALVLLILALIPWAVKTVAVAVILWL
jgi:hypothetical protein